MRRAASLHAGRASDAACRCRRMGGRRNMQRWSTAMASPDTAAGPHAYLDKALRHIARLRATGPNPFDYFQWADETTNVLKSLFGEESDEVKAFRLAVSDRG